ncbi:MAG: radical SAM protein [Leptospirillum sp.]
MKITELFRSIQGESLFAGWPCFFIRTSGCPLRCTWCDTTYSFYGGTEMTVDEILLETRKADTRLVEITGGEPFAQPDLVDLANLLRKEGYEVLIETSGGFPVPAGLDRSCHVIMDIKPPGSGMSQWMNPDHFRDLVAHDEIKAVCQSREDFDWVVSRLDEWQLPGEIPVTVSPVFDMVDPKDLGRWVLESRRRIRIQIQLHKILFDPKAKGV